jgi:hypothetical protein
MLDDLDLSHVHPHNLKSLRITEIKQKGIDVYDPLYTMLVVNRTFGVVY